MPLYATPITPTTKELIKYAADDEDMSGISEACRISLTKFRINGASVPALKYVKHLIGKDLWFYYNGSEKLWKWYDPDGDYDKKNRGYHMLKAKVTDNIIEQIQKSNEEKFFTPKKNKAGHSVYSNITLPKKPRIQAPRKSDYEKARELLRRIELKAGYMNSDLFSKTLNHPGKSVTVDKNDLKSLMSLVKQLNKY